MSDDNTASKNYHKRIAQELQEFENDPIAKRQKEIDYWWELKLARRAASRRSVIPEIGEYDEMRRFEEELDYQQELADRRYTRGL
jgi:hypothetical protein